MAGSGNEVLDLPAHSPALRDEGRAETFYRSAPGLQAPEKIAFTTNLITHNSKMTAL
jgi:hypothetical protein